MMKKVALLIGVSEYQPGLNPLPASTKDIEALKKVLENPEIGNFNEVKTLTNPDPQKMGEAIERLFSDRHKDDLALLYFSGHGITDESNKLFFATSITRNNPSGAFSKATAVPANFIHDAMSSSLSKRQIVILDCCFSGAFANGMLAKGDGFVDIKNQLGGEGRAILTSSTSIELSFEEPNGNLSIYTNYLLQGIKTGAADKDGDGLISVDELHEYVHRKVKEAAPTMTPQIYAIKEGYKIKLAKAPVDDPKLQYRKEVEYWALEGKISEMARIALDALRNHLKLAENETKLIEEEVLNPRKGYNERLEVYAEEFRKQIKIKFPISKRTRSDLARLQQSLRLEEKDIFTIETGLIKKHKRRFEKLIQLARTIIGSVFFVLAGYAMRQQQEEPIETVFCPKEKYTQNLMTNFETKPIVSAGEKILLDKSKEKESAINGFSNSANISQAILKLQAYRKNNPSDPEVSIYLNNAKIMDKSKFQIAASVPIGTNQEVSREILRGVAQAQNEVNESENKINGKFLKVVIANDNNNKSDAKNIATQLVGNPNTLAVVGHNKSETSLSAANIYSQNKNKLTMISPTSDATQFTGQKSPIFHVMPLIRDSTKKLGNYAVKQKIKKILICWDLKSDATKSFRTEFMTSFEGNGGEISEVACDLSSKEFKPNNILKEARDVNAVLLLPGVTSMQKAIELAQANRGQRVILGSNTIDSIQNLRQGGCSLNQAVLVIPWDYINEPGKSFFDKGKRRWGVNINWRTAMAYDATMVVVQGLRQINAETNLQEQREQLVKQLSDDKFSYNGVTGEILLHGERDTKTMLLRVQPSSTDGYEFVPF
jgi:branched-chain amino acid transport system substrate-binding protein